MPSIEQRVCAVETQVEDLCRRIEDELAIVTSVFGARGSLDETAIEKVREVLWVCPKCQKRLGIWDPISRTLRMRSQDHVVRVIVPSGNGTRVETTCQRCAWACEWSPSDDEGGSMTGKGVVA
jgi:hypothetical protein